MNKNENEIEKKGQIFYRFNNNKADINTQIEKSFIIYLKDIVTNNKNKT